MGADRLVCQQEKGKENGFLHWQFYVSFKQRKQFTQMRSAMIAAEIPKPIWLRGVPANSKDIPRMMNYCRKKDTRVADTQIEVGTPKESKKGQRNDLTSFRTLVQEKKGRIDVLDPELQEDSLKIIARYPRFVSHMQARYMTSVVRKNPMAVCFWGPTGTGKTARARMLAKKCGYEPHQIYVKNASTIWWDNYDPSVHRCVLVDEVRDLKPEVVAMFLEQMSPGYLSAVQIKGGTAILDVEMWLFTSPKHPLGWVWDVTGTGDTAHQFVRRFTSTGGQEGDLCFECKDPYVHPEQLPPHQPALIAAVRDVCAGLPNTVPAAPAAHTRRVD
jgi:hypothetical protein